MRRSYIESFFSFAGSSLTWLVLSGQHTPRDHLKQLAKKKPLANWMPFAKFAKGFYYTVVNPQLIYGSYTFSWKKANQSHTHHKITNSAKNEAIHTIKLKSLAHSANKLINTISISKCGIEANWTPPTLVWCLVINNILCTVGLNIDILWYTNSILLRTSLKHEDIVGYMSIKQLKNNPRQLGITNSFELKGGVSYSYTSKI